MFLIQPGLSVHNCIRNNQQLKWWCQLISETDISKTITTFVNSGFDEIPITVIKYSQSPL